MNTALGRLCAIGLVAFFVGCAAEEEPQTSQTVGSAPTTAPAPAPADTTTAPTNCDIPYTIDSTGRKHYKAACLTP